MSGGTVEDIRTLERSQCTGIDEAIGKGLSDLFDVDTHTTILVFVILLLIWFIRFLLTEAKEERSLNRNALTGSTTVLAELKELIRGAIHK